MSDHWQHGPPDPYHGHGNGGSTGGYTSPSGYTAGGYDAPAEGYGPPPPVSPYGPHPFGPGPYGPHAHAPGPYPPGPHGAPPPPYPVQRFHPYYVERPDRTSAVIALVVSVFMLFSCMNPVALGGLIFSAISLSEAGDHDRAARHARYAWYSVAGGFALIVLGFGFLWTLGVLA